MPEGRAISGRSVNWEGHTPARSCTASRFTAQIKAVSVRGGGRVANGIRSRRLQAGAAPASRWFEPRCRTSHALGISSASWRCRFQPAVASRPRQTQTPASRAAPSTGAVANPASCGELATLNLPTTTITAADDVAAGAFVPPVGAFGPPAPPGAPSPYTGAPSFCRVVGTISTVPGSEVRFEVWLKANAFR